MHAFVHIDNAEVRGVQVFPRSEAASGSLWQDGSFRLTGCCIQKSGARAPHGVCFLVSRFLVFFPRCGAGSPRKRAARADVPCRGQSGRRLGFEFSHGLMHQQPQSRPRPFLICTRCIRILTRAVHESPPARLRCMASSMWRALDFPVAWWTVRAAWGYCGV